MLVPFFSWGCRFLRGRGSGRKCFAPERSISGLRVLPMTKIAQLCFFRVMNRPLNCMCLQKNAVGRFCLGPVSARLPEPENAGRGIFRRADPDRASGNGAASAVIGFGYSFDFRYLTFECGAAAAASETKTRSAGPGSFVLRRSANGPAAFLSEAAHSVAERFRKTKKRSPC